MNDSASAEVTTRPSVMGYTKLRYASQRCSFVLFSCSHLVVTIRLAGSTARVAESLIRRVLVCVEEKRIRQV